MTTETIAEGWAEFSATVLNPQSPPIQRQEMRRAFYAGVYWLLLTARELGEPDYPEMAGVLHLQMLAEEMNEFQKSVLEGKA